MDKELSDLIGRELSKEELQKLPRPQKNGTYKVWGLIEVSFIKCGAERAAGYFLGFDCDLHITHRVSQRPDGSLEAHKQDIQISYDNKIKILKLDLY